MKFLNTVVLILVSFPMTKVEANNIEIRLTSVDQVCESYDVVEASEALADDSKILYQTAGFENGFSNVELRSEIIEELATILSQNAAETGTSCDDIVINFRKLYVEYQRLVGEFRRASMRNQPSRRLQRTFDDVRLSLRSLESAVARLR